jgi:predicted N-acetyltransferase YhbS
VRDENLRLRIVDEAEIEPTLDARIRQGLCVCFPADVGVFGRTRHWHGVRPVFSVIAEADQRVVAHVGVVHRVISVAQTKVVVAGLQNVFVLPEQRGTGLSGRMIAAATQEAGRRRAQYGLLFCVPEIAHVYARCGWRQLRTCRITRVDETGAVVPLSAKNIAMYFPLAEAPFPSGDIHLEGNDW